MRGKSLSGTINIDQFIVKLFLFSLSIPFGEAQSMISNSTHVPVKVGLVFDGLESSEGKAVLSSIEMAIVDFYAAHGRYNTRLALNPRDSNADVIDAAASALDLIKNEQVQAILGPTTSTQADFVISLAERAQVPVITFTASSPFLTSFRSPFLFLATQNDSTQVNAITAIVQAFGWREAVPIYIDNEYGRGILPYLIDALEAVDARVPYRCPISSEATDDQILIELYKLKTMQTRVFIVHMSRVLGFRLFAKAKEAGMISQGYVWIMTDGLTNFLRTFNRSVFDSMQGLLGVRPYVPWTKERQQFKVRWKRKFQRDNPDIIDADLNIFDLWGYDATTALAMALEQAGITSTSFAYKKANASSKSSSTDLNTLGVSQNGVNLLQALANVSFRGLTGYFKFVDGQLPAAVYQIVNVRKDGARRIGFWTPGKGLAKSLSKRTNSTTYSTRNSSLASIIWPGDPTYVPKGWEIPTSGKKLRVGVPEVIGFFEFVRVSTDPSTNRTIVTGYSIDVFEAAVKALPYPLTYDYFVIHPITYDDLIYQVYLRNFDAVVADTTIRFNRSLYVDFTLPYTESGVKMIVPIKDTNKSGWIFLKPLTGKLWVTIICSFVSIGFVVWFLEHRINDEFRGPPLHQVGTGLWFSLSTMVFAHRERVASNLTRMVVVVWCFVMLILTQSYTASLTSLLTVTQFQPTVTNVNDLIERGDNVGYQNRSFVQGILQGLGFNKSNLVPFNSTEDLDRLFQLGSGHGGIAAAFDELPYVKLFLARYCSKYELVEPTYQNDGFGFVFPKGSPLADDVSRAILQVKEAGMLQQIEKKWLANQTNMCSDPSSSPLNFNTLDVTSFWGLFVMAGVISISAVAIHGGMFLYKQRENLKPSEPNLSIRYRIGTLGRIYDRKDSNYFASKKIELNGITHLVNPSESSGEGGRVPSVQNADQIIPIVDVPPVAAASNIELVHPDEERSTT